MLILSIGKKETLKVFLILSDLVLDQKISILFSSGMTVKGLTLTTIVVIVKNLREDVPDD